MIMNIHERKILLHRGMVGACAKRQKKDVSTVVPHLEYIVKLDVDFTPFGKNLAFGACAQLKSDFMSTPMHLHALSCSKLKPDSHGIL